jgi:hypothetical protein
MSDVSLAIPKEVTISAKMIKKTKPVNKNPLF